MNCFGDRESRSIWLPAGVKNTKFFHQRVNQRRHKNHISGVMDKDGNWHTFKDHIAQVAKQYFQDLFTSAKLIDLGSVLGSVDRLITPNMNNSLL